MRRLCGEKRGAERRKERKRLTFGLCDGGGGGDGAEGGAAREGGVGARHGHRVTDPGCRVDGSDRLVCVNQGRGTTAQSTVRLKTRRVYVCVYVLTARKSEVALR